MSRACRGSRVDAGERAEVLFSRRMTSRRAKVLFVAEAVTLAHVGRMLSLAEAIRDQHEVLVAYDERYRGVLGTVSMPVRHIRTIPGPQFFKALQAYRPDIVVGDFRLSLAASARLERVPYISVTNAYWSPYAQIDFVVPDIPPTRFLGVAIGQKVFDLVRPLAFAQHAAPVNRMLRHFSLPRLPRDLRHTYTEADFTLYSDVRELVATTGLPVNHQFIGPVQWAPDVPLPSWWPDVPRDKPIVYVNLGSSGHAGLLPAVLAALRDLPVTVIAASAGRAELGGLGSSRFVTDFLPGDRAATLASIVVCNGGSPTCYQALAAGKPIIGIPTNLDQYLNMSLVARFVAGVLVRGGSYGQRGMVDAVQRVLATPSFADRARAVATCIERYAPANAFSLVLQKALDPTWTRMN